MWSRRRDQILRSVEVLGYLVTRRRGFTVNEMVEELEWRDDESGLNVARRWLNLFEVVGLVEGNQSSRKTKKVWCPTILIERVSVERLEDRLESDSRFYSKLKQQRERET